MKHLEQPLPLLVGDAVDIQACWNEIGVHGNGSCWQLQKFILCRNCPVYASAGVRLLDRPAPPEYRRECKEHFARDRRLTTPHQDSAVIFRISAEWLALPTQALQEVAERQLIHSLPHRRHGVVLGLANIRGELLICVSLGHLLALENPMPRGTLRTIHQQLLVVNWDGDRFVFPVDAVGGIHRFDPRHLQGPPATLAKSKFSYSRGILSWEQKSVGLLDPGLLFSSLNRSLA